MAENKPPEDKHEDNQAEQLQDDFLSEDDITRLLLDLKEHGSLEDLHRIEALLRIDAEARAVRAAAKEMRMQVLGERLEAITEGRKMRFEAYKNLTVLDSGALVAFAVITHNLVGSVGHGNSLYSAYAAILVSLCISLAMMFVLSDVIAGSGPPLPESEESMESVHQPPLLIRTLAPAGFFIGLSLFLGFLGFNL